MSGRAKDYDDGVLPQQSAKRWVLLIGCCLGLGAGCLPRDEDVGRNALSREPGAAKANGPDAPKGPSAKPATSSRPRSPAPPPPPDPALGRAFSDDFERTALGADWRPTSGQWRIEQGKLCASGARNHPIWLKRRLPTNATIEFDATSASPDGDIKAEFWGDGSSRASGVTYNDATSYLTIWGGWKNSFHVLARLDEHAKDRQQLKVDPNSTVFSHQPVQVNRLYRFRVERQDGKTVTWSVDGKPILNYADPEPLLGSGHEHFGYNNWSVPVCFDNLKITALGG